MIALPEHHPSDLAAALHERLVDSAYSDSASWSCLVNRPRHVTRQLG